MRALVVTLLLASGCSPATLIVASDAGPMRDARAETGTDAASSVEPRGGSECDQQDDCNTCFSCVQGPHQACVDYAVSCSDTPECVALVNCLNGCGTEESCARACGAAHPSATAMLVAFYACAYCDACTADCREQHGWCEAPPF
jgi:hypothetical protein